ncbi:MAG: hypothetical protein WCF63_00850, partial [Acidimicrobiales bacterium]
MAIRNKLQAWKPVRALEFYPDPPAVTVTIKPTPFMEKLSRTATMLSEGQTVEVNLSRQNLTLYGNRLAKIVEDEG